MVYFEQKKFVFFVKKLALQGDLLSFRELPWLDLSQILHFAQEMLFY